MKKNINICLTVLFINAILLKIDFVSAKSMINSNESCKINDAANGSKSIVVNFTDRDGNISATKHGKIYNMTSAGSTSISTSDRLFCLNPDHTNKTTYHLGSKIPKYGGATLGNSFFYKAYQYYQDTGDLETAQIVVWWAYNSGSLTKASLINALLSGYTTSNNIKKDDSLCQSAIETLKEEFNNKKFTCECYLHNNCSHDYEKVRYEGRDEKSITNEDYNLAIHKYYNEVYGLYGGDERYKALYVEYESLVNKIWNYPLYSGDLYYWEPDGSSSKYQKLIGLTGCDHPGYICKTNLPKYQAGQFGTVGSDAAINAFKASVLDPQNVVKRADGTVACDDICDPNDPNCGNPECDPNDPNCDEEKCDPVVNTETAKCDAEMKQDTSFTLSDAMQNDLPNKACYQKGTAYKIEGEKVGSKDEAFSKSKYCDVYCWESVTANMPGTPSTPTQPALAGRMMYWGMGNENNGWFANLQTKRVCWTKPDYSSFSSDWRNNEAAIVSTNNEYKALQDFIDRTDYETLRTCHIYADCEEPDNGDAGTPACVNSSGNKVNRSQERCTGRYHWVDNYGARAARCNKCPDGYSNREGTSCQKDGISYKRDDAETECFDGNQDNPDALVDALKTRERNDKLATLQSLLRNRNDLYNAINACQSQSVINANSMYTYTAKMEITTKEANNYGVTDYNLDRRDNPGTVTTTPDTGRRIYVNCSSVDVELSANNPCKDRSNVEIADYSSTNFEWNYEGSSDFYYKDSQFMFYAIKENMKIVNDNYMPARYIFDKNSYYKEGYGFPISFTKLRGTYDISVSISGLGNNGHFDKILEQTNSEETYGYDFQKGYYCPYYVDNPIYKYCPDCPKGCTGNNCYTNVCTGSGCDDLDIVYRLIEMGAGNTDIVFPGKGGNGRVPGSNWATFIANRATAFKNITTSSKIYDSTPLYTIELTPTNIGKIRNDNKTLRENGKDPYTSYYDEKNNFKITCTGDGYESRKSNTGDDTPEKKSCVSSYITELIKRKIIRGGKFKIESEDRRLAAINNYKTCYDNANPSC